MSLFAGSYGKSVVLCILLLCSKHLNSEFETNLPSLQCSDVLESSTIMLTIYGRTGRAGNTGWAQFVCVFEFRQHMTVALFQFQQTNYQPSHMIIELYRHSLSRMSW